MQNTIIISKAEIKDARHVNTFVNHIFSVAQHLISTPSEADMGYWKRRHWITRKTASPLETCFLAKENSKIVGMLECWSDHRLRVKHVTTFGMSVHPNYQGQGIGSALLETYISWVSNHKILQKIELHVHSDNEQAIMLYEKFSFQREGSRRAAVKYQDGRIIDDYLMALIP